MKVYLLFIFLGLIFAACSPKPIPPSPETVPGVYIQTVYEFYRWEEGLALMIWHDGTKSSGCASSSNDQSFTMSCYAVSNDDVRFDWRMETEDGISADFSIDGRPVDLTDGNLFIITTSDGDTNVRQFKRELSKVVPNAEQVIEFGLNDPDIWKVIQVSTNLDDCISSLTKDSQLPDIAGAQSARQALIDFFDSLNAGEYEQATELFGGSYDVMQDHNPDVDPDDHAALFRNACTINGAQCLEIREATLLEQPSPAEFRFAVQFVNEDGSPFSLGSCCGDEPFNGHQQEEFHYTVRQECTGRYLVLEMPVYEP